MSTVVIVWRITSHLGIDYHILPVFSPCTMVLGIKLLTLIADSNDPASTWSTGN